jgi:hypothetical protein
MRHWKRLGLPFALGVLLVSVVISIASEHTSATVPSSINSGQHFLPPYGSARDRIGFDSVQLSDYDVAQLHAGWYTNWGANLNPAHPDQLVYVQTLQFTAGADPTDPSQVIVRPNKGGIAQIATAHPGSLWLLGNEPDSLYQGNPILPEVYAVLYHDYYDYIKDVDPTALLANGGIVQPTPCRLAYLDIVYDRYLAAYGKAMPVDVWNTHAFTLREVYGSWGASTPPGVDPSCGIDYAVLDADDVDVFLKNIKAMRIWMQERGYQEKPLIVSEYGILWPAWFAPQFTPARVSHFMTRTFDLFLDTKEPEIGYPADDNRLVQAWAWYSLSDDSQYNGNLFYSSSKALSPIGEVFSAYAAAIGEGDYADLSVRLVTNRPDLAYAMDEPSPTDASTLGITLTGSIANLGKLPLADVTADFELLSSQGEATLLAQHVDLSVPARFGGVVALQPVTAAVTAPGIHSLRLRVAGQPSSSEPRDWNNVDTAHVAILPDLSPISMTYEHTGSVLKSGDLILRGAVRNQGTWTSPRLSVALQLAPWPDRAQVQTETISLGPLAAGSDVVVEARFDWREPDHELYHLGLNVDDDGQVSELDESNNTSELLVPVALRALLSPTSTVLLTSASGAIGFVFPAGAVTTSTEVLYEPLWPAGWETGVLRPSRVAFSLTALVDGQVRPLVFSRPVSIIWRYADADARPLDEDQLRLFVEGKHGRWHHAVCVPYERDSTANWLVGALCQTGRFVFGYRSDNYYPLLLNGGALGRLSESESTGSPLRMP